MTPPGESDSLFDALPYIDGATHPLTELDPARITLTRAPQRQIVGLQRAASRALWRPAPGRKQGWTVQHDGRVIALMFLASPVINLAVRDAYLDLPPTGQGHGEALRSVSDLSVCVGIQPLAWHWNLGKLAAMLAASDEVAARHTAAYGDALDWITTTSLYGRGTQYNRVYKFLGYTKGYGHAHISDDEYAGMLRWMRGHNVPVPSSEFGAGSNPRMRRIAAYQRATGARVDLRHGDLRGVYITPARQGSAADVVARWYARWGLPRYERTRDQVAPYQDGKQETGQAALTSSAVT